MLFRSEASIMTKDTEEEQIMKEFQRRRRKQHQTG
jgi:hypothetical protein